MQTIAPVITKLDEIMLRALVSTRTTHATGQDDKLVELEFSEEFDDQATSTYVRASAPKMRVEPVQDARRRRNARRTRRPAPAPDAAPRVRTPYEPQTPWFAHTEAALAARKSSRFWPVSLAVIAMAIAVLLIASS